MSKHPDVDLFTNHLESLLTYANEHNKTVSADDVMNFFSDIDLDENAIGTVFAYLNNNQINVLTDAPVTDDFITDDMFEDTFEANDDAEYPSEETIEDTSLMSQLPFGLDDKTEETTDEIEEETEEYPKEIQLIFNELDKLFNDFKVKKAYGKMPFADGERLQYCVTKGNKEFNIKENTLKKLGVNWFITDKGNLYIYTL